MEKVVKYILSIGIRFLNSISKIFDFSTNYIIEDNIQELHEKMSRLSSSKYYGDTKLDLVNIFLYDNILHSDVKYPKEIRKIEKEYYKQIPYAFNLATRNELASETYDTEKVAKIILDILYLKKDELDKIDGGRPVN